MIRAFFKGFGVVLAVEGVLYFVYLITLPSTNAFNARQFRPLYVWVFLEPLFKIDPVYRRLKTVLGSNDGALATWMVLGPIFSSLFYASTAGAVWSLTGLATSASTKSERPNE